MIKILIHGALGKMGKKVYEAAIADENVTPVCGVDIADNFDNKQFPIYDSFDKVTEAVDVIVDFSLPSALDNVLAYALKNGIALVSCTTGYEKKQVDALVKACEKIAIFRSANMSLGVNVLVNLVQKAAQALTGFDIEIIEKHHNQKVDAPSGTALLLADAIDEELPGRTFVYGREGKVGKRTPNEIGIHAVRGGNIVGDHDVLFAGVNETITLSHQAFDRSVFAVGAIRAAKYIVTKKMGMYDMQAMITGY